MKMKIAFRLFLSIAIVTLILASVGCKKVESKINKQKLTGHVQKGPYINGTNISMSELNSSLEQTGKIFTTQISDNSGSFEIRNISLSSSYVEFAASGYYFDEVKGDISIAPLDLFALSDITDISTVNVNIMTHLEKLRVENLVNQDKTLSEAKKTAQGEILAIFGFSLSEMDDSETLDISVNSEENAILLAISIILQGNRTVGDLTELLAGITNDIRDDGILNNQSILNNLRNSTKEIIPATVRTNLVNRFKSLGTGAEIPGFEKYLNDFLVFTGQKPETTGQPTSNITTTSATLNVVANANSLSTTIIFEYGTSASYGNSAAAAQSPLTGSSSVNVNANITSLLPGTTYHFRVKTENTLGIAYSSDLQFTTLGQLPSAESRPATNVQVNSATINGSVNPNYLSTTVSFEYGTSTGYGNTITPAQSPVLGSSSVNVSADITGLSPGTTYHFRVKAVNALGTSLSSDLTFTTLGQAPTVVTNAVSLVNLNSATINGSVKPNYLTSTITFEWGTTTGYGSSVTPTQSPVIGNSFLNTSTVITGLLPGTTYHFRVKAANELGTTNGNDLTFATLTPLTDAEGNVYNVTGIGTQVWMADNLKTTKYSNSDLIGTTTPATFNISGESEPKYQWPYEGNESNVATYGRLYTWYAVADVRNVCPTGWHVPSDAEWTTLTDFLINNGFGHDGAGIDIAKSLAATSGWISSSIPGNIGNDQPGNNSTGFTSVPGGYRFGGGLFENNGFGMWWSATEFSVQFAWWRSMGYNGNEVSRANFNKLYGMSVRCVRNN